MVKKSITVVLIMALLFVSTGVAFSGWSPRTGNVDPAVVPQQIAHPWEEDPCQPYQPSSSYPSLGSYPRSSTVISLITSLVFELCVKQTVEKKLEAQNSNPKR